MKKVMCVFVFLLLVGGALAMSEPVSVKAVAGDEVKVYAWPADGGQLLTMNKGIADANGDFNTTFFSLNVPAKFSVIIIRDGEKILDEDFLGHSLSKALNIDCSGTECKIVPELVVGDVVNDTVNDSVVENDTANDSVVENMSDSVLPTGMAVFVNEDGSIKWFYSFGSAALLLFVIVFIFMVVRRNKNGPVVDDDDKELRDVENKVRETAEKIKKVKGKRDKVANLEKARAKLAKEEAELRELEKDGSKEEVKDQEAVVERAEGSVDDAKQD